MSTKNTKSVSFENTLTKLEKLVQQLESGELSLDDALSAFEQGIQLTRQAQQQLQHAEQRVQILLNNSADSPLTAFDNNEK